MAVSDLHSLNLQKPHALVNNTAGSYAPAAYSAASRSLLNIDSSASLGSGRLFGARRLLAMLPSVNKLVAPTCTLSGQQAEPACVHQGKCAKCFEKEITDIGLQADVSMVSREACLLCTICVAGSWVATNDELEMY